MLISLNRSELQHCSEDKMPDPVCTQSWSGNKELLPMLGWDYWSLGRKMRISFAWFTKNVQNPEIVCKEVISLKLFPLSSMFIFEKNHDELCILKYTVSLLKSRT